MNKVVCFGEMLWDIVPSGKKAGGAPMNVAFHLKKLGLEPYVISSVGNDSLGDELLEFLNKHKLSKEFIQITDDYPTSTVIANISNVEVQYDIVKDIAWDYIELNDANIEIVKNSELLLYGTLGQRNAKSWDTLLQILPHAKLKFFDLNLREPHYTKEQILTSLEHADIVKMNETELELCAQWFCESKFLDNILEEIIVKFNLQMICYTMGAEGAMIVTNEGKTYLSNGYKVEVKDTIGSGDSFLAAIIQAILQNKDLENQIKFACALGAKVASSHGATPDIELSEVYAMME
jgi:fructokinase